MKFPIVINTSGKVKALLLDRKAVNKDVIRSLFKYSRAITLAFVNISFQTVNFEHVEGLNSDWHCKSALQKTNRNISTKRIRTLCAR